MTAFLMKTDQLTFEKAYEHLQTIQPEAKCVLCERKHCFCGVIFLISRKLTFVCLYRMNEGFEWQLKLYQLMGCEVDTCSAIYKQYRLRMVTEKYPGDNCWHVLGPF